MRHRVNDPDPNVLPEDLNLLLDPAYTTTLKNGNFEAAFWEDGICDGCVSAHVGGLPANLKELAAFSLVSAPDFFPYADELELQEWVDAYPDHNAQNQFKEGGPDPLCRGRFGVNPALHWPGDPTTPAFDRDDQTIVAIVGRPYAEARGFAKPRRRDRHSSQLTDAASNEFGPGWDVTFSDDGAAFFYSTYGLGSPFPEDVKFCASANAYWPAASPDASRTYHRADTPTAIPLLDAELGYHPMHPKVLAGLVSSHPGWDGEYGPFFEEPGRIRANHASLDRADYISNALAGTFAKNTALDGVDSDELVQRMDCLRLCIESLPNGGNTVNTTKLWLVVAEKVPAWDGLDPVLTGVGYLFEFVLPDGDPIPDGLRRMWQGIDTVYTCRVTPTALRWSDDGGITFNYIPPASS